MTWAWPWVGDVDPFAQEFNVIHPQFDHDPMDFDWLNPHFTAFCVQDFDFRKCRVPPPWMTVMCSYFYSYDYRRRDFKNLQLFGVYFAVLWLRGMLNTTLCDHVMTISKRWGVFAGSVFPTTKAFYLTWNRTQSSAFFASPFVLLFEPPVYTKAFRLCVLNSLLWCKCVYYESRWRLCSVSTAP